MVGDWLGFHLIVIGEKGVQVAGGRQVCAAACSVSAMVCKVCACVCLFPSHVCVVVCAVAQQAGKGKAGKGVCGAKLSPAGM